MGIFQKITDYGISSETGLLEITSIRKHNIFNSLLIGTFFLSGIIGLIFGLYFLALFNISASVLLSILFPIYPPHRAVKTGTYIGLILPSLIGILLYFFEPEISWAVLIFFMLFPIASVTLLPKSGIAISASVLPFFIVGNFIPMGNDFVPLNTINLLLYATAYSIMLIAAALIRNQTQRIIKEQVEKVDYYEAEISQRDEFISSLSHKLRTSLSNITLINNLVQDAKMSSDQKDLLDTLRSSTFDLINDVNKLVEVATPTILDYKQSILSFSLSEILEGTIGILESEKNLTKELTIKNLQEINYNIIGDPSLLKAILINLFKGIAEYKLNTKEIFLSVSKDYETQNMFGIKFLLEFQSSDFSRIKESFLKTNSTSNTTITHFNIAKKLLAMNGGKPEILINNEKVNIFFYQDFSKDFSKNTEKEPRDKKSGKTHEKKAISESNLLLVEDNVINQKIVILSLNKLVKSIDLANNGKEALDMFGTKNYDVILMDIQMPVMDGITAIKKMRELEATTEARIPIIAITANALSGDRDNCMAAGADDYVSKPFQVDDLVSRISKLLSKNDN